MTNFLTTHRAAIEAFINTPEAAAIVESTFDENELRTALETRLGEPVPHDLWGAIADDLYDWWKNGNFYVHDADEVDAFNIGAWTIDNDPYFASVYDNLEDNAS